MEKKEIGFYAGSFDPFTNGHLHVLTMASKKFSEVIVGIGRNPKKVRRFDNQLMKSAIEKVLISENITNVRVMCYDGFTADVALENGCSCLIRGIRNEQDYVFEEQIASINKEVSGIDTIYIRADNLGIISSSMVMELLQYGKDVSKYLPKEILEVIVNK